MDKVGCGGKTHLPVYSINNKALVNGGRINRNGMFLFLLFSSQNTNKCRKKNEFLFHVYRVSVYCVKNFSRVTISGLLQSRMS